MVPAWNRLAHGEWLVQPPVQTLHLKSSMRLMESITCISRQKQKLPENYGIEYGSKDICVEMSLWNLKFNACYLWNNKTKTILINMPVSESTYHQDKHMHAGAGGQGGREERERRKEGESLRVREIYQPRMEELHIVKYKEWLQHSIYLFLVHSSVWAPLEPCNMGFQQFRRTSHLEFNIKNKITS